MTVRDAVLNELERNKGTVVSGRALADRLKVSRTAVWKAVADLREDGYEIEASTNRGYVLAAQSDRLSEQAVRSALPDELQDLPLYVYDSLESTNQTAKQLALSDAPDGTVVLADHQTSGRGRKGRSFFSPPATGIYMTMLLRSPLPASQAVRITTAASVAVARAVDEIAGVHTQIKWINDLYLNGRKLCGILTDGATNMENGLFEYVVVGIGVNVNTPPELFPEELRATATSVFAETGCRTNRSALAAAMIRALRALWATYTTGAYLEEYRARSCVLGKTIRLYGTGYEGEEAVARQIDENGYLIARTMDGREVVLNSGEITIRPVTASQMPAPSGKDAT